MEGEISTSLQLTSRAFKDGDKIPKQYTCEGQDMNPPLEIGNVPEGTKSLALVVDDPTSTVEDNFVHWIVYNLKPTITHLSPGMIPEGAIQTKNSYGKVGYGGPCPKEGTHQYFFKLYALDVVLDSDDTMTKDDFEQKIEGCILDSTNLRGWYDHI